VAADAVAHGLTMLGDGDGPVHALHECTLHECTLYEGTPRGEEVSDE
jgi:hypothetical protein